MGIKLYIRADRISTKPTKIHRNARPIGVRSSQRLREKYPPLKIRLRFPKKVKKEEDVILSSVESKWEEEDDSFQF